MKKLWHVLLFATILSCLGAKGAEKENYAKILDWRSSSDNECGGYYFEPQDILEVPNPPDWQTTDINVKADYSILRQLGQPSFFEGHVKATQPGRELTADRTYVYRAPTTAQITSIDLFGHVRLIEAGKLMVGESAHLDVKTGEITLKQGIYRFTNSDLLGTINAWGRSSFGERLSDKIINLRHATYSTCPPVANTWHLDTGRLRLDKEKGRGQAFNTVLYVKNVPVFYLPYINFPLNKDRKTGFLYPAFGFSKDSGTYFSLPFYLNLAPNYDDLLTTHYYSKRGVKFDDNFRYMTEKTSGELEVEYIPHDSSFAQFKEDEKNTLSGDFNQPYLNALDKDSDSRGLISWTSHTQFDSHWSSKSDINWVSDDYFMEDFSPLFLNAENDQLLNQIQLDYQSSHWNFTTRVAGYQTLHDVKDGITYDTYQRLPEFDWNANYPEDHYTFSLTGQAVNFEHARDFFDGSEYPTGLRTHLFPEFSFLQQSNSFYVDPQVGLDMVYYSLSNNTEAARDHLNPNNPPLSLPTQGGNPTDSITRVLPVLDIDSGMTFARNITLGGKSYRQTLEPRLFYLFVPQTNQDDIPLFDTSISPFNYDQIFRLNRFSGIDRFGDANQLAYGVTTRLFDSYTGMEKFSASVAEIAYFKKRSVCLYANCVNNEVDNNETFSPIAGKFTYNLTPIWQAIGQVDFNPTSHLTDNDSIDLYYLPAKNKSVHVGYNFVRNGDIINPVDVDTNSSNLNRIDFGFQWPLANHWQLLDSWNYNISRTHNDGYFYGLQYDTCCWAMRVVASRVLTGESIEGALSYHTEYFVQFLLRGLGSVGNDPSADLITSNIPNYFNPFKG